MARALLHHNISLETSAAHGVYTILHDLDVKLTDRRSRYAA